MPFLIPFWGSVLCASEALPLFPYIPSNRHVQEKKKRRLKVLRFAAQKNGQILAEGTCLFVFCVILMSRTEGKPFQDGVGFLRLNAPATVRLKATTAVSFKTPDGRLWCRMTMACSV